MSGTDKKPKARIKITLECDRIRTCSYCINKCDKYRAKWQTIKGLEGLVWGDFRTIIVSGGEPTTDMRLRGIVRDLRIFTSGRVPIYLQTNGWGLTKKLVQDIDGDIDGIGLSIHDIDEFRHMLTRWEDIARIKPVRLYVQNTMYMEALKVMPPKDRGTLFTWRVWADGEYDATERIFLLKGWKTTPAFEATR